MKVKVIQYQNNLSEELIDGKIAIIIDIFRATSVITTALANGAKDIIATRTIEDALTIYDILGEKNCILGDEKKPVKRDIFHTDTSPLSYLNNVVNKTIILTTNGTHAINYCKTAKKVYIASFLNATFVANLISKQNDDIVIICADRNNEFALENACCAGKLLHCLANQTNIQIDDFEWSLKNMYELNKHDLSGFLSNGSAFSKLLENGLQKYFTFCLNEDLYPLIPQYKDGRIIANTI